MDGGGQLTDPVVERDRARIAIIAQGTRYRASVCLPACDRTSARAICLSPKWGSSLFHHGGGSPRNSEQFSSATATCYRVGGRLMARQAHWEGKPVSSMGRREFVALLSGAASGWPLAAQAQQRSMPVIGFIYSASPDPVAHRLRAFRQGLKEYDYVEGENCVIVYRWAESQNDRLAEMVADLTRREVSVITAMSTIAPVAAKAANTTIPIIFQAAEDPVRLGLVESLSRPGGNATGVNFFIAELTAKRLEFVRELVPTAKRVGCSSIRTTRQARRAHCKMRGRLRAQSGYKSWSPTRAPVARSMQPSRSLCASKSMPSLLAPLDSSPAGAFILPVKRCGMEFLRSIPNASFLRSAGF